MTTNKFLLVGMLGLGLMTTPIAWADGPGRGRGNGPAPERGIGPPDRGDEVEPGPPVARPEPPGHSVTPPGLGGNQPPGHGGPNPGRGHGVPRGRTAVCGSEGPALIGPEGQAGASHVAHVEFSAPEDSDSESWARMTYFWVGSSFGYLVNAHQLEPGSEWTLIARATDDSALCLGEATANPGGELHLAASLDLESHLPEDLDPFAEPAEGEALPGASLELVPGDAVDCGAGSVSTEADNVLTSDHDIRFVDVDEVVCPE